MDVLKRRIVLGELKHGDKMPSVREFSKDLVVNPTTIQRVYRELEHEELTYTKRGMGSFVTEDIRRIELLKEDMAKEFTDEFIRQMISIGMNEDAVVHRVKNGFREEENNASS